MVGATGLMFCLQVRLWSGSIRRQTEYPRHWIVKSAQNDAEDVDPREASEDQYDQQDTGPHLLDPPQLHGKAPANQPEKNRESIKGRKRNQVEDEKQQIEPSDPENE